MTRWESRLMQGLACALIAAAVPVVLWLSSHEVGARLAGTHHANGVSISYGAGQGDGPVTYRFLYRDEAGAIPGRLTLGRFTDGVLDGAATWGFVGIEHCYTWAPDIFEREPEWAAEDQPGWRISQWLEADSDVGCDSRRLFWALQTLRFLDPVSVANEIDMLDAAQPGVRIRLTAGNSDYDYETDTLTWNPTATCLVPANPELDRQWFRSDPLVTLAHELSHAWHDRCRNGDTVGVEEREQVAIRTENRIRHILFLKDPTREALYPRPGHTETWADLPGLSAAEAWHYYRGEVKY